MYFGTLFIVGSALFVAMSNAQFSQYPPQFSENPLQQPFNPLQSFHPYRGGGYQLRSPPPPRFNPYDHVYNEKGEKLTCKMVCSPNKDSSEEEIDTSISEKKDSGENKLEKKE